MPDLLGVFQGSVRFDSDGSRLQEAVRLLQFRNGWLLLIVFEGDSITSHAYLTPLGSNDHHFASVVLESGEFLYVDGESNASVWPGKEKRIGKFADLN